MASDETGKFIAGVIMWTYYLAIIIVFMYYVYYIATHYLGISIP